jgi:hypothetical protein
MNPTMAGLGRRISSSKFSIFMSRAIPNMINERAIFRNSKPEGEKFRLT